MPIITVEGPAITDLDVKRSFVKALTDAAEAAFGIPREAYVVLLKENARDNVGVAGQLLRDRHGADD